jgi:NTE family protein
MGKKQGYAVVFGGGGIRGAYEVGAWKAIREKGLYIESCIGSSIGAINAAFALQDADMEKLYTSITLKNIIGENDLYSDLDVFNPKNLLKLIKEVIVKGRYDSKNLEEYISKYINLEKIYSSPIDLGVVICSTTMKPIIKFKQEIPCEILTKHLVAASCFPIFKAVKLGKQNGIDGGFYDNVAINVAIDHDYQNIIAIDLKSVGRKRKIKFKNGVKVFVIEPSEKLGGLFEVNKTQIERNIDLGYQDTKKFLDYFKIL